MIGDGAWISFSDSRDEGQWAWRDGDGCEDTGYTQWAADQPSSSRDHAEIYPGTGNRTARGWDGSSLGWNGRNAHQTRPNPDPIPAQT